MKEKAGEKDAVKAWANKASLYRDAVEQLRKGYLYVPGTESKVVNNVATADKIDEWVRNQFVAKLETGNTDTQLFFSANAELQAYLGTLYQQAIARLRDGTITSLNYKATADAIDAWVNQKFMEKTFGQV